MFGSTQVARGRRLEHLTGIEKLIYRVSNNISKTSYSLPKRLRLNQLYWLSSPTQDNSFKPKPNRYKNVFG